LNEMGSDYVVLCDGGGSLHWDSRGPRLAVERYDDVAWERLADGLNRAGAYARDLGMRVAYHPHIGTNVESADDIDKLLAITDHDMVSIVYDTGHICVGGGNPLAILVRHYNRVACIHFKDVRPDVMRKFQVNRFQTGNGWSFIDAIRAGLFTTPGDGCIDFQPIIRVLQERDYKGWMIIEAEQNPALAEPRSYAATAKGLLAGWMSGIAE